ALSVADPARLDAAVEQIFGVVGDLTHDFVDIELGAFASQRQAELLRGFESIVDRGRWCADYLQFTKHDRMHLYDLAALRGMDAAALHSRAARLTRKTG